MPLPSEEDRLAIIELTIAYCWALDTRDWAGLESVFTRDATAELVSPTLMGLDAITERVASVLVPLDDSQHLVTNHQVTIDESGDTASCRCYVQAQHVRRDAEGGPNFVVGGRYEDTMVRTADGWRIRHRRLVSMWSDGNAAVVRGTGQG